MTKIFTVVTQITFMKPATRLTMWEKLKDYYNIVLFDNKRQTLHFLVSQLCKTMHVM